MKHTPGPWVLRVSSYSDRWMFIESQSGERLAECTEHFPDARLIAAAPELVEMLEFAMTKLEFAGDVHSARKIYDLLKIVKGE